MKLNSEKCLCFSVTPVQENIRNILQENIRSSCKISTNLWVKLKFVIAYNNAELCIMIVSVKLTWVINLQSHKQANAS